MNKKIVCGSAVAVAVAALLVGDVALGATKKYYQPSKAKTVKSAASPEKHKCNANGCPAK